MDSHPVRFGPVADKPPDCRRKEAYSKAHGVAQAHLCHERISPKPPASLRVFAFLWNDGRGHPVPIGGNAMAANTKLRFLEDKWDEAVAAKLGPPELLRYRSNLLGSDLRITNFGGGNTSSKLDQVDPLDGATRRILWVKGSGGDLGSI